MSVYNLISDTTKKKFVVLIDPDKPTDKEIVDIVKRSNEVGVDLFFVGGSLLTTDSLDNCIKLIKKHSSIPVLIFPGNSLQISKWCDGFLLLSLISGRNPEMLIGRHVIAAPYLKLYGNEIIPTGYMLIDSGRQTSVSYMSNTTPIPYDKDDIAMCTAIAGEMLGLKVIYMDAGSGAMKPVSKDMIYKVKHTIEIPLIVGGGINTPEKAEEAARAGADIIVVGNVLEKNLNQLQEFADAVHKVI